MVLERLHPSHSAPDLSELVEARTPHAERDAFHDALDDEVDDDDVDGARQALADIERWRLPTPADSRSPTPEVDTDNDYPLSRRHHLDRLRIRSESPEVFRRARQDVEEAAGSARMPEGTHADLGASNVHNFAGQSAPLRENKTVRALKHLPASLWDYLREELRASDLDGSQELKTERISNFFSVPKAVEQVRRRCTHIACILAIPYYCCMCRSSFSDTSYASTHSSTPSPSCLCGAHSLSDADFQAISRRVSGALRCTSVDARTTDTR